MSMSRDSDQEARPMDLEGHERCYLMNQEIGAQERHANETAQPWRNGGKSHGGSATAPARLKSAGAQHFAPLEERAEPVPVLQEKLKRREASVERCPVEERH